MMNLGLFYDCFLQSLKASQQLKLFTGWLRQPHTQPPTSLFVWIVTFDLSGMGDPTSGYATASIGSQDHMTTQALPLRQSRDTYGGGGI
jgi:hypothetical protein